MSDYDAGILTWSERQAELLRHVAAGDPLNERPDWPNIIEELADVGRRDVYYLDAHRQTKAEIFGGRCIICSVCADVGTVRAPKPDGAR